ncbi:MAG: DUF362 domain-containing protein [Chitinivibrionales bacterium]|nr:DUF362 domain-containing protein [Chitinivibrionales bacterium]
MKIAPVKGNENDILQSEGGHTMASKVSIAHNPDIAKSVPQALDMLGDLSELFKGKHVAIKPNDTWVSPDDTTACTQADTVQAAIRYVKQFSPRVITITGGSGDGQTDEVFRILGIDRIIREERVAFFDHNRPPFESVRLDSGPQEEVMVNPHIFSYDTLVSLSQHKVHKHATVTLTMKNIGMSYPAADYYGHPRSRGLNPHNFFDDLHGFIAAMCKRFPPQLGIITGHPAMTDTGPIGGYTFESDLVVAGTDFVATDTIGAWLLGKEHVAHIEQAAHLVLGTADMKQIEIAGMPLDDALQIMTEKISAPDVADIQGK